MLKAKQGHCELTCSAACVCSSPTVSTSCLCGFRAMLASSWMFGGYVALNITFCRPAFAGRNLTIFSSSGLRIVCCHVSAPLWYNTILSEGPPRKVCQGATTEAKADAMSEGCH